MKKLLALVSVLLALPALALAQARPLEVRSLGGSCGESTRGADTHATSLSARAGEGGVVTVSLSRFSYYCRPAPVFDAELREDGTIALSAREPTPPVARCVCPHEVRLRLQGVPPGRHAIEVRFRDEVRARGEVTAR